MRGSHCSLSENHAAFISGCSRPRSEVLVIAISLIVADLTCHWPFCSNEHGTSAAASWGGTDAFTCVTAARTLSRTIRPASYPGVSVGLLIPGQSSWILTVSHAGHSQICLQVRRICIADYECVDTITLSQLCVSLLTRKTFPGFIPTLLNSWGFGNFRAWIKAEYKVLDFIWLWRTKSCFHL